MKARLAFVSSVAGGIVLLGILPLVGSEKQAATTDDAVARGEYLVIMAGCGDCHSPKTFTPHGPVEDTTRLFAGHPSELVMPAAPAELNPQGWIAACNAHMTAWTGPWGVSFASNLTSDKKTGLGNWTDEQFIQAMRTGKHRGFGRQILPPMPWVNYGQATDEDLKTMLAFLKSTKPVDNQVPEPMPPAAR
jgi:cytochrome c551/c552